MGVKILIFIPIQMKGEAQMIVSKLKIKIDESIPAPAEPRL